MQFATRNGKPMAGAEVRVFAPGQPGKPVLTGRADQEGRFEFPADKDGFWSAEARTQGEVAKVMIRVGGERPGHETPMSPWWILGGLGLLLVLAFSFRVIRARSRRRRP